MAWYLGRCLRVLIFLLLGALLFFFLDALRLSVLFSPFFPELAAGYLAVFLISGDDVDRGGLFEP